MARPSAFPDRNDLYNIREMTSAKESDANPRFEDINDPALTYCLYAANCSQTAVFKRSGEFGVSNMKECIQERQCTAGNASDFGYVKWCEAVLSSISRSWALRSKSEGSHIHITLIILFKRI